MKLVVLISLLVLSACGKEANSGDINTSMPVGTQPALMEPQSASGITSDTQCGIDFIMQNNKTYIVLLGSTPQISQSLADNAYFVGSNPNFCKYIIYQGLLLPFGTEPGDVQ